MNDHPARVVGTDLGDEKSLACVYRGGEVVGWF